MSPHLRHCLSLWVTTGGMTMYDGSDYFSTGGTDTGIVGTDSLYPKNGS